MVRKLAHGPVLARKLAMARAQGMTEDAEHYARLLAEHRWCATCGRALSAHASVDAGRGPECRKQVAA